MDKYPLISTCICVIVLLVMSSLSNVRGYQTSQVSNNLEKDITLKSEINLLPESGCGCEIENTASLWKYPATCMGLYLIFMFFYILYLFDVRIAYDFVVRLNEIGTDLGCFWAPFQGVNQ